MRRILIVGATSAIAEATAREFANKGDALFLVGRSLQRLHAIADDLKLRGASNVAVRAIDLRELREFAAVIEQATQTLAGLDMALIAHGTLSDQKACEGSVDQMVDELTTNALSFMALCTHLANRFEAQGHGTIAVISSVAGDRGRQSNYVYGSAKAAVTAFSSGLRQRLYTRGVKVVTIKPGFVSTPMTAAFKKNALWASAEDVGRAIAQAMMNGTAVLYVPGFWRLIMWIIRCVPESIFRRLKL